MDDCVVYFPGPGPGQAIFFFGPIQAVLIEKDEADVITGFYRFRHRVDPPVPGLYLPDVQPARQKKKERQRRPDHAGNQAKP